MEQGKFAAAYALDWCVGIRNGCRIQCGSLAGASTPRSGRFVVADPESALTWQQAH